MICEYFNLVSLSDDNLFTLIMLQGNGLAYCANSYILYINYDDDTNKDGDRLLIVDLAVTCAQIMIIKCHCSQLIIVDLLQGISSV